MSDTPITDAEESRQRDEYERNREAGDPPFACDFEFARKLERELNNLRVATVRKNVRTSGGSGGNNGN